MNRVEYADFEEENYVLILNFNLGSNVKVISGSKNNFRISLDWSFKWAVSLVTYGTINFLTLPVVPTLFPFRPPLSAS